ncbi:MAG TPA: helix-turn-helix domain-containing protein, partial [Flavobacteriales bacterium]|nr:helix-turn-helix domain-containing protein [Flavobacteriales bacterium]
EEENTHKFRNQLVRLMFEDKREELLERIEKGGAYYHALLHEQMKGLFKHLAQVELLSKTKEYGNELKEIDGMLMKKIATIAKVGYIATCILNGTEIQRQKDIEQGLVAKRAAMVGEARAWAEENRPKGKTGKRRKRRSDADEVSDSTSTVDPQGRPGTKTRALKGSTYETTYAMLKEGFGADEIASTRSMAKSTIEGHFARGIAEGKVEIDALMPAEERDTIADWMRANTDKNLNDAQQNFKGKFSYGQLRMVQAWVKKEV